jgi:hypothetical protein
LAAEKALGAMMVPELACRICKVRLLLVPLPPRSEETLVGDAAMPDSYHLITLAWLINMPLELVRYANLLLAHLSLSALEHSRDKCWFERLNTIINCVPDSALDALTHVAFAGGAHDALAVVIFKVHLGWRAVRLAMHHLNLWHFALEILAQNAPVNRELVAGNIHDCARNTYSTLVAIFASSNCVSFQSSVCLDTSGCVNAGKIKSSSVDAAPDLQWRLGRLASILLRPLIGGVLPTGWLHIGALQEVALAGHHSDALSSTAAGFVFFSTIEVARITADALSQSGQHSLACYWYANCLRIADALVEPEEAAGLALVTPNDIQSGIFSLKAAAVEFMRSAVDVTLSKTTDINNSRWHSLLIPSY